MLLSYDGVSNFTSVSVCSCMQMHQQHSF